ncbi:MAG: DNRLRE domain-containing protein [bacterium]
MYVQDHEEALPSSANIWSDLKLDPGVLICPTKGKNTPNGYVIPVAYDGVSYARLDPPTDFAMVCDGNSSNVTGNSPNLAFGQTEVDYRHSNKAIVAYADGHVGASDWVLIPRLSSSVTVSLQQGVNGYTGTQDTFIGGDNRAAIPNTNYASNTTLGLFNRETSLNNDSRCVLRFDLTSLTGCIKQVTSATLTLTGIYQYGSVPDTFTVNKVTNSDWKVGEVTWNSRKTGTSWGAGGGEYASTPLASLAYTSSSTTTLAFALTANPNIVRDWANSTPSANSGIFVLDPTSGQGNGVFISIASSEAATVSSRPKLDITYVPW